MKYSERDLIRYYTTKDRINKRKNRIKMQQSYCRANIKEGDSVLTPAQRQGDTGVLGENILCL